MTIEQDENERMDKINYFIDLVVPILHCFCL